MSFIFSEMQLAQNIDDAYSMAKVMAQQNHKAKMHSILAMTPDEIDAMVERVQGSAF
jgi:Trp operon repressor